MRALAVHSPDDYDFDDPKYQADLDRLLDRLAARRRADRSRFEDPLSRLVDHIYGNPYVRQRPQAEEPQEPVKQIEKPLPEALPVASTVDELRAHLGKRKGPRSGRKVKPIPDKPTLDLDLIEKMFQRGATLAQIRAHLRVGMQTLKLELLLHLPHIAEEASKRRGRKPKEIDIEQVRQMREEGMALHLISAALGVDYKRLVDLVSAEPSLKRRLGSVDTAEVLRLHAEGLTQTQIAAELGCCAISVYRRIKQARQEDEATEQSAEETKVREMRSRGVGWKKIAAELHASRERLRSMYGELSTST